MDYTPIIVTAGQTPNNSAQPLQILFVLPFLGTPAPLNRLAVGVYFSTKNTSRATGAPAYIWQNVMTLLTASIEALIATSINTNQGQISLTENLLKGTNTITHNLRKTPRIIQFYQSNGQLIQFIPNLNSGNPLLNFTIYADKPYSNVTINIIAF